jgi:hypothetical protein
MEEWQDLSYVVVWWSWVEEGSCIVVWRSWVEEGWKRGRNGRMVGQALGSGQNLAEGGRKSSRKKRTME